MHMGTGELRKRGFSVISASGDADVDIVKDSDISWIRSEGTARELRKLIRHALAKAAGYRGSHVRDFR